MGNYYFAKDGNKVYFKLTGVLKYTSCGHFDTFLDDFIAHADHVESIVIDLTEATFLDSTNLGFLAKIAQFMLDKNGSQTTIYSTSKDVNQTLRGVGFDQVFNLYNSAVYKTGDIIDTYVYNTYANTHNLGMSAAAGLLQSLVGCLCIVVTNLIVRRIDAESSLF